MRKPINVKELFNKTKLLGSDAAQFFDAERDWRDLLSAWLDPALLARIAGIAARPPRLTIYAESAAWSARLRYALAEIEPVLRARDPAITRVEVRVRPKAAGRGSRSARGG